MKHLILLTYGIFSIISCSSTPKADKTNVLDFELEKIAQQGIFNGFSVAIVNDKGSLYQNGFGFADASSRKPYTENTIQNIASVSKTFVGIALMKAQELGKLDLDDPINKYLPFAVFNPNFPDDQITIRQLANHTSSIQDNEIYSTKNYILKSGQDLTGMQLMFDDEQLFNSSEEKISMQEFFENSLTSNGKWFHENAFTRQRPGSIYEYSNVGTALAAYIVELAAQQSFYDFTEQYITKPLKMKSSGWRFQDIDFTKYSKLYENPLKELPYYEMITYPDGGFITSAEDLSKFLSELIKGYNGKGTLLSKESYAEYFKPQLSVSNFTDRNESNPYSESYNVGIFIGYGYTDYIGHTGGDPGVMSMMFFDPKTNYGRIMIFNTNFSDKKGNDTFYRIWDLLEKYQGN